jgi:hypothetical protein
MRLLGGTGPRSEPVLTPKLALRLPTPPEAHRDEHGTWRMEPTATPTKQP